MLSQVSQYYRLNHIVVQNFKKNKSSKLYRTIKKQSNLGQVGTTLTKVRESPLLLRLVGVVYNTQNTLTYPKFVNGLF